MHDLEAHLAVLLVTLCEVAPELSRAVLVGIDDPSVEGPELGRDNLEEILEHVAILRGLGKERFNPKARVISSRRTYHPISVIQRMINDSHLCPQGLCHDGFALIVLVVRGKLHLVDDVTEIMSNTLFLQVRNQFVYVLVVRRLERTTGREMYVASDLVDTETTGNVATLVRLFLQFFRPSFFDALVYPVEPQRSQKKTRRIDRPELSTRGR